MLEPSLELYGETFEQVCELLTELVKNSYARYAVIIDLKGFVLAHTKALWAPKPPSLDSLATLIASNYSANLAIAHLFGEAGFKEMVQQGDGVGMYVEELGTKALLVTVFDERAVLGRVKLFTKKTVSAIEQALADNTEPPPKLEFDDTWQASNQTLLDGLFGGKS